MDDLGGNVILSKYFSCHEDNKPSPTSSLSNSFYSYIAKNVEIIFQRS
jgi:hypothetical protein